MSIPASQIVSVNPRLLTPGGDDLEFNGLLMTPSDVIPTSQLVIPFPDPDSVGEYFGMESEEYQAAVVYFLGYNNSFQKPRALYFARRIEDSCAPYIRGGSFSGVASRSIRVLRQITNGGLRLTLGVNTSDLTGLNFSSATTMSDVAQTLQAAIRAKSENGQAWTGATVTYSSLFNAYTITGGAVGDNEGVEYAAPAGGVPVAAAGATLAGGTITTASFADVTDGAFKISIGGQETSLTGLDFSSQNDTVGKIAAVVRTALNGKGVTVATTNGGITIKTEATGAAATLSYATAGDGGTDISGLLALTQGTGAVLTQGADATEQTFDDVATALNLTEAGGAVLSPGAGAMSIAENMETILDLTENFVCFTTRDKPTEDDALAYAQWSSGKGVAYLYIYWDDDPKLLQPNNTATIAAALTEANVGATCGVYNSLLYAAMIMGTAASIDWNRRQGTITFAFKSQDGLPANVVKGTDATYLTAQNVNFMGDYATRNDQFVFMYPGVMFGQWKWIDTYLNAVWLNNALQVACMVGFQNSPRVPYNSEGYALIRAWMQDPVDRALYCGIIDTGVTLSNSQVAQLTREAGRDISGELYTDGYVIQVNDPAPAVRWRRESPEVSCFYCYGGSVHKLSIASTALV